MTPETAQHPFELEQMVRLVADHAPKRILEVGVWHGGTLRYWLEIANTVVGVDDTMFEADEWRDWAATEGADLHLIQGNSLDAEVVAEANAAGPYDFVFIDAAHDYTSVKADWENYGRMAVPGGLVAFHDIAPRDGYGVSRLWSELKPAHRTMEVWSGQAYYCGVGFLWL